ncbi:hypothetical protein HMPREF9372_3055 [Sporosarcina newyorkensis 2681]|uniref:Uncharacterized protein n=1 Tax=Sporosarcina newyorkensis 2681 TaxID=1027292 RepID=F9DW74_9BACL|nr:hypothetical protein HMPREF9372_3055 [Sporosarcina newyorkensis 2681]
MQYERLSQKYERLTTIYDRDHLFNQNKPVREKYSLTGFKTFY